MKYKEAVREARGEVMERREAIVESLKNTVIDVLKFIAK